MALYNYFANEAYYAEQKGYFPIVDLKNYKSQYWNEKDNSWEWFFSQPQKSRFIDLNEVYKSRNVIISGNSTEEKERIIYDEILLNNDEAIVKACSFVQENFIIKKEILEMVEKESRYYDVKDCIGLCLRGTDYTQIKPLGERVQPTIEQASIILDQFIAKYQRPVFLVTEDEEISNILKSKYSGIISPSFERLVNKSNWNGKDNITAAQIDSDIYYAGAQYLAKIIMLSRCKYLIAGITGGSKAAVVLNGGKYEDKYLFDLGFYE